MKNIAVNLLLGIIHVFQISIIPDWKKSPSNATGFLIIDEIAYLADICDVEQPTEHSTSTRRTTARQFSAAKTFHEEIYVNSTSNLWTTSALTTTQKPYVAPLAPTFPATQTPRLYSTTRRTNPTDEKTQQRVSTTTVYFPTLSRKMEMSACSLINCRFDGK